MSETLLEKVSGMILADINKGVFDPTRRLPGYRELAVRYKISWGTVIEALGCLERGEVVERRARSGTYISPKFLETHTATRSIAFLFPEREMSQELLGGEQWTANSEIFLGLVAEAQRLNARVDFKHVVDSGELNTLTCQERQLRDYDAVVMVGPQLAALRRRLETGKTVVVVGHHDPSGTGRSVCMPEAARILRIGNFIEACGYRSVSIIRAPSDVPGTDHKVALLTGRLAGCGIAIPQVVVARTEGVPAETVAKQADHILNHIDGELVMNFQTNFMPAFFHAAMRRGMRPGEAFDLLGLGSGALYANYYPPISYFRTPYFAMGKAACRMALGMEPGEVLELNFIQGRTTRIFAHDKPNELEKNKEVSRAVCA